MNKALLLVSLSISSFLINSLSSNQIYNPPDNIALDCGNKGDLVAQNDRKWTGDVSSMFLSSHQQEGNSSSTSKALTQDFVPQIPYMTARVFRSSFTYSFKVNTTGPKFIRLHFHPSSYSTNFFNITSSYFSVIVNNYTMLSNYSTLLDAQYKNVAYFVKEFYVNMVSERDLLLNVTFNPSKDSFAYVNGIEVVSVPTNLYNKGENILIVGQYTQLPINNGTALETAYRINIGAITISPMDDTGMFRTWSQEGDHIFGGSTGEEVFNYAINLTYTKVQPYTAPEILYLTGRSMGMNYDLNERYNLTWYFPVDSGFYYLVRLHFCEIAPNVTGINQRVFQIFLNNKTAENEMDIMVYGDMNKIGVPIFRDFIVHVPGNGDKMDLWLALHPLTRDRPKYSDALLNGLEIFKLNRSDGSLAGHNPTVPSSLLNPKALPVNKSEHHSKLHLVFVIAGISIVGAMALSVFILIKFRKRKQKYDSDTNTESRWLDPFSKSEPDLSKTRSLLPLDLCRHFSLDDIKSATNDFSADSLIGVGGFGNVYKGYIEDGLTPVAIKRLNPSSQQGVHEFHTEIETLSRLRHMHLVSLIGYCAEQDEMILMYDYMARGTIRDHLYNTDNPPLPWKMRLQICIGAARGLHYLHTGVKHTIIHRDVKTPNILLDDKWTAKVSDFGLSRIGPTSMSVTHVSTLVKGSFGYLDPEYYLRQRLTVKSDVYSFGVVLFEVLCARPPLDKNRGKLEMCLSDWARAKYKTGKIDQIIDPYLRGKIAPECLKKFGEVANNCLKDHGIERPTMNDVVCSLEFALQLQICAEESGSFKGLDLYDEESPLETSFISVDENSTSDFTTNASSTLGLSGAVFSEIMNPEAR